MRDLYAVDQIVFILCPESFASRLTIRSKEQISPRMWIFLPFVLSSTNETHLRCFIHWLSDLFTWLFLMLQNNHHNLIFKSLGYLWQDVEVRCSLAQLVSIQLALRHLAYVEVDPNRLNNSLVCFTPLPPGATGSRTSLRHLTTSIFFIGDVLQDLHDCGHWLFQDFSVQNWKSTWGMADLKHHKRTSKGGV